MDELTFRQRAYANPQDADPDFLAAAASSESNQALVDQLQRLDLHLSHALQEPVPKHLAATLLAIPDNNAAAKPSLAPSAASSRALGWRHLAIAASLTFVLGFSTRFISFNDTSPALTSMSQIAMEHVYAESAFTSGVDEQVTLTAVNAKLQPYGTQLQSLAEVGQVYYANHCLFGDGPAAHLVIQGEHHRVHVFIVPPKRELNSIRRFSDQRYHGEIVPMELNHLVVIGEQDEDIDEMAKKIQSSLERSI
ncbi:DUF3379 family protein [Oceanisphaera sp. W20_SRM_FM3]|uniref:DUF3379 family protein n=1 Tax=Oceanisphaera sp. W20_SRM_FM3 TaxID=3240267 RepID=UPI003F97A072